MKFRVQSLKYLEKQICRHNFGHFFIKLAGKYNYPGTDQTGRLISEYWWLFAEYGMSSHVTNNNEFIVGAPSARKWKGAIGIGSPNL